MPSFSQLPFVFHTARHLIPHIIVLETILRSVNTHKLCPRAMFPSPLSLRVILLPLPPHLFLPTPRFLVPSFRFSTPSPDEMGRSARARARARGTQLKVSHTGGHAVPRRAAPRRDDRIDPSLRSQIPACRLFSAVLLARSHRNRFAVADCPRSSYFALINRDSYNSLCFRYETFIIWYILQILIRKEYNFIDR